MTKLAQTTMLLFFVFCLLLSCDSSASRSSAGNKGVQDYSKGKEMFDVLRFVDKYIVENLSKGKHPVFGRPNNGLSEFNFSVNERRDHWAITVVLKEGEEDLPPGAFEGTFRVDKATKRICFNPGD